MVDWYIYIHPPGYSWNCLGIGSFFDTEDRALWRIEIFLACGGSAPVPVIVLPFSPSPTRNYTDGDSAFSQSGGDEREDHVACTQHVFALRTSGVPGAVSPHSEHNPLGTADAIDPKLDGIAAIGAGCVVCDARRLFGPRRTWNGGIGAVLLGFFESLREPETISRCQHCRTAWSGGSDSAACGVLLDVAACGYFQIKSPGGDTNHHRLGGAILLPAQTASSCWRFQISG
ncbi:hypothetical protein F4861DRAFT_537207 [Xylaria intraflava]|nr:hypothetical protein F4861DRAFT_537207 [Xylaria intraflava]